MNAALEAVAASELVTSAVLASLIRSLSDKGLLSPLEVREIYESALLMIETAQGSAPASEAIFAAARELIEQHLRQ